MPSPETDTPSRSGFAIRLIGILAVLGGFIAYAILLRKMQSGPASAGGVFGSATPLIIAAIVANLGALVLMVGLAALRDRASLRLAGLALGILLIVLDMPTLDALTGPQPAKAIAVIIGIAFIVVPWFIRGKRVKEPAASEEP